MTIVTQTTALEPLVSKIDTTHDTVNKCLHGQAKDWRELARISEFNKQGFFSRLRARLKGQHSPDIDVGKNVTFTIVWNGVRYTTDRDCLIREERMYNELKAILAEIDEFDDNPRLLKLEFRWKANRYLKRYEKPAREIWLRAS